MTPRLRAILPCALLMFVLVNPARADDPPTNELCPVMKNEKVDPKIWVEHEGKRVYLCCRRCRTKFLADPGAYIAAVSHTPSPTATTPPPAAPDPPRVTEPAPTPPNSDAPLAISHVGTLVGRLHVFAVHFPIALILTGLLAEFLRTGRRPEEDGEGSGLVARTLIVVGALGAIAAAITGWLHADFDPIADEHARLVFFHRWVGVATAATSAFAAVTALLCRWTNERVLTSTYRLLLLAAGILVLASWLLGTTLVWGGDYFIEPWRGSA